MTTVINFNYAYRLYNKVTLDDKNSVIEFLNYYFKFFPNTNHITAENITCDDLTKMHLKLYKPRK